MLRDSAMICGPCLTQPPPFDRAVAFYCANIEQGTQGEQSRLTGYDVDELIAHIKRSAATGQAVNVKWRVG